MAFLFVAISLETFLHCCFNNVVSINCVDGPLRLNALLGRRNLSFSPAEKKFFMRLLYQEKAG